MKKKHQSKKDDSLKTFFVYTYIVLLVVCIALSIRAFFVLRASKFDGKNIDIAILQNKKTVALLGFNASSIPQEDSKNYSSSLLKIQKNHIPLNTVGKELGIIADASIDSTSNLSEESPESILTKAALRSDLLATDLTIFDIVRLIFISRGIPKNGNSVEQIVLPAAEAEIDKKVGELFRDSEILKESLTIQIINATSVPGLGRRLERAIVNKGGNVIVVSTAAKTQKNSVIKYFEKGSYTSKKIKKFLKIPSEKTNKKNIADIVIIIGEDLRSTSLF